eukprot:TRINITY_DN32817_c0_g1_i1.p1 TRINITY_DN32817_c0_g1~~TRINITY_DN32817_c0_g1_i1.p1  ORF type:complete len:533 (-),score=73.83 TRINITY_DN32817_c0_g1_i1:7-1605(-)
MAIAASCLEGQPKRARVLEDSDGAAGRPEDAEQAAVVESMMRWLRDSGAVVDGVRVESAGAAGCRLVAARDLPANFVFFRLPERCVASAGACAELPHGRLMRSRFKFVVPEEVLDAALEKPDDDEAVLERPMVTLRSALYTALMLAPSDATDAFGPYLALVRRCAASTPFTWGSDGGIESLDEAWKDIPPVIADEWRDFWDTLHIEFTTLFPALSDAYPEAFPADRCTALAWIRAHSLYTSRAFPAWPERPAPDGVMLPFMDLMNHDVATANVEWCGVGLEDGRGARTTRALNVGEELLYSYGCKGNAELILGYGFAVWGNPHELARVCVDLEDFVPLDDAKFEVAVETFEAALDSICGGAAFCERRDEGKATFKISTDSLALDARDGKPWRALCQLCSSVYALLGKASPEDLLTAILTQACARLRGKESNGLERDLGAWDAYVAAVRAEDSVTVGAFSCAISMAGMTVALKDAQLLVLYKASERLSEMDPLPKSRPRRVGNRGRGRGRGRGRRAVSSRKETTERERVVASV